MNVFIESQKSYSFDHTVQISHFTTHPTKLISDDDGHNPVSISYVLPLTVISRIFG